MNVYTLAVSIDADASRFTGGMKSSQAALTSFEKNIDAAEKRWAKLGSNMMGAGKTMTAGITLPLAAIAAGSVSAAIKFESSFAGVRKTVDATEAEFAKLSQGFRDMSKEIPIGVNELNRIGEAAGALGIHKDDVLEFTRTVALMAVTTDLTADAAADAFARIANIMGTAADDYSRLGSVLVGLGNSTASTESEIVSFGLRIAGAGKIAGMTEPNIMAIGAAMASVGVEAEAGGTAVQKVLLNITKEVATGGEMLEEYARVAGMSAKEFAAAWKADPAKAFVAFVEGLGKAGDDAIGILDDLDLKDQRLIRSFLSLAGAGDLLNTAIEDGNRLWGENAAMTDEAAKRFETFESKMQTTKNKVIDVGISLGEVLLPQVEKLVDFLDEKVVPALEKAVEWFDKLPEGVQSAALGFLLFLAVVGPIVMGIGLFASGISSLIPLLGMAGRALVSLFWTLSANPFILVVAGILALGAALIYAYNHSESFRRTVNEMWLGIQVGASYAVQAVILLLGAMVGKMIDTASKMLTAAEVAFSWSDTISAKLEPARAALTRLENTATDTFAKAAADAAAWRAKTIANSAAVRDELGVLEGIDPTVNVDLIDLATGKTPPIKKDLFHLESIDPTVNVTLIDNASAAAQRIIGIINSIPTTRTTRHSIINDSGAIGNRYATGHTGGLMTAQFHTGGAVETLHSGGLKSNELMAKLLVGEYVMQPSAVDSWGVGFMDYINAGRKPSGGAGGGGGASVPGLNSTGGGDLTVVSVVNLDGREISRTTRKATLRTGRANNSAFGDLA